MSDKAMHPNEKVSKPLPSFLFVIEFVPRLVLPLFVHSHQVLRNMIVISANNMESASDTLTFGSSKVNRFITYLENISKTATTPGGIIIILSDAIESGKIFPFS